MANLNLSQFGENTSVSDADYTFVWDSAASISKKVSRNSWLNSGTLTSDAPVTISQTWNYAAVAFTALKVNATSTNSAAASKLLDLQLGTVSKFSVDKNGLVSVPDSAGTGGFVFRPGNTGSGGIGYLSGGNYGIWAGTGAAIGFSTGAALVGNIQTALYTDGSGQLALRNGAGVPQAFRVYNTFLGTTANEWFEIDWKTSAGTVRLFTMHGGTGVARNIDITAGGTLYFGSGTSSPIRMYSGGVERWNISATGHFIAAADNTYDIGASGANRPRNVYVGTNVISRPADSITPANNGEFVVEATSNTTLTFKLKGTDGTVRSGTITLA